MIEGLDKVISGAGAVGFDRDLYFAARAHKNDRQIRMNLEGMFHQVNAAHAAHEDITNH